MDVACTIQPCSSATATSQSSSTPPPCPPSAAIAILIGRATSEGMSKPAALRSPLEEADDARAQLLQEAIEPRRIEHELCAIERRTQHRRVRHFAAHATADTGVVHVRDRILSQRIGIGLDRQRRTTGQADARVIARARIGIHTEPLAYHARAAG